MDEYSDKAGSMGVLFVVSLSEGSPLLKVVGELTIRASDLVFVALVLAPAIGYSVVHLGDLLNADLLALTQLLAFSFELSGEGIFQSVCDSSFAFLLPIGFFILMTKVVVVDFVAVQLHGVVVIGHELVVSVQLVGHSALASMLDKFNRGLAPEGDLEGSSEFHLKGDFHVLVTVEILLAGSGVVPVGLDHWIRMAVLLRKEWWSILLTT